MLALSAYAIRHFVFSLQRLFGRQRHPYLDIDTAEWPLVTVFVPAHNEARVIAGCLDALCSTDYPSGRLKIVPIDDRSTDGTDAVLAQYARDFPGLVFPFERRGGACGKSAALKDALRFAEGDIVLVFDADYVPNRGLLKQLVAPFFDPEVGAVMGRVVPANVSRNLLTRLLDLERSAGYQVDQQARMNLALVPQYGGTVGGIRRSAMEAVGGWHADMLAEDTDITIRLLINGWKTIYTNRSECYEEVPEEWPVRVRQVQRWARGHNQVLFKYWRALLTSGYVRPGERLDGLMLLGVFVMPLVLLAGWCLALALYYVNGRGLLLYFIPFLALMGFGTLGNFAVLFEIVIAVLLDGNRQRIRLLPLNLLGFCVSMFSICGACLAAVRDRATGRTLAWSKTLRYRTVEPGR